MSTESSILDLILRIRKAGSGSKETQDDLDKLKKKTEENNSAFGGMVKGLADVKAGFDMAGQVINTAGQVMDATVGKAAAWGDAMGDLAQMTGASVRDTSKLAAAFELVGVSSSTLEQAIKGMTKNGLALNMTTIKDLAQQYQALQDPVQKNEFLFKNFGRAGTEMAEILGRDTAELDRLGAAALRSGKVIGEDAAGAAEEFNLNMAILQQRAEGAQIAIGNALIPTLNAAAQSFDTLVTIWQMGQVKVKELNGEIDTETAYLEMQRIAGIEPVTASTATMTVGISEATAAMKDQNDSLPPLTTNLGAMQVSADAVKASFGELTNQLIFNQVASTLDAAGQLELARQLGLVNEKTYGAISAAQELKNKYDTNHDGAVSAAEGAAQYIRELAGLKGAMDAITDKTVTVTVKTVGGDIGQVITGGGGGNQLTTRRAAGGPVMAGIPTLVGERGPELIVPQQNGWVVNNYNLSLMANGGSMGVMTDFAIMRALSGV